jgi:hypothetical protein
MNKGSSKRLWLAFKTLVVGSTIVSSAVASVVQVAPRQDNLINDWRSVGQDVSGRAGPSQQVSEFIVDMIDTANLSADLEATVRATYGMITPGYVSALDSYWISVLTSRGDAAMIAAYVNLRSGLGDRGAFYESSDSMVWLAAAGGTPGKPDGCDGGGCNNGSGNDSEGCSPGQGGGANDDEEPT